LPGSGKTTLARYYDGVPGHYRISRDDIRRSLFGKTGSETDNAEEQQVTKAQHETVLSLLRAGMNVHVDDTCLPTKAARTWLGIAEQAGAEVEWVDLRDVQLKVCLERTERRDNPVPTEWIVDRWQRYCAHPAPNPTEPYRQSVASVQDVRPYVWDGELEDEHPAYIFDVDGTLSLNSGYRSPYETELAGYDLPNKPVIEVAQVLSSGGYDIIVCSGRSDEYKWLTYEWLMRNGVPCEALYMRKAGDKRPDWLVKRELLDEITADGYGPIVGVYDDRDSVVAAWRAAGLTCFQVAPGAF
jgi:predicted kinase